MAQLCSRKYHYETVTLFFNHLSVTRAKPCLLLGLLLLSARVYAGQIIISGVYQGKNLYVQNPLSPDKVGFCANEVFVNDKKTISNIKLGSFEVDLSFLEIGESVTVRITHKDGCAPKLLNPQVLRPSAGFQIEDVRVLLNSIEWSVATENKDFVYNLESLRNGNWIVLAQEKAKGSGNAAYSVPMVHPAGENRYRIRAQDLNSHQMYYSRIVTFDPDKAPAPPPVVEEPEPITFTPKNPKDLITLSADADFEITDSRKKIVAKGKGRRISVKTLKAGNYQLKINEQPLESFVKK
ncbi:MAG: hypothetical protein MUD08_02825 [Cytophagales bacterium]|nr:hypothetical protein [Cytophagales bacterium]